jgi:hypothetical protein
MNIVVTNTVELQVVEAMGVEKLDITKEKEMVKSIKITRGITNKSIKIIKGKTSKSVTRSFTTLYKDRIKLTDLNKTTNRKAKNIVKRRNI